MAQPTSIQRDTFVSVASSSCSPSIPCVSYDVFINHRGPDVKNTFAGHLYQRLKSRGLQVFLDRPELQAGHDIPCQIKAAIEVASVHIAIFTENYAESKWCLKELVLMLNSSGKVLPVFYKVKPSDLRYRNKRKYAEDLDTLEEDQQNHWKTIRRWKKALAIAADIKGFELEECNGDEVELVDKVMEMVLKDVRKPPLLVAKYEIGLQEIREDFERRVGLFQLEGQSQVEARVVGILGSGGIGKSTLAREFFNTRRSCYNFSSFLFNVRENAATKSLTHLQRELIQDIKGIEVQIKNWQEGVGILKKNLKSCHALIILDDVDHLHQLDALLPIKDVLHPMSLILITSRDKHVLRNARIYKMKGLDRPKSLELFCSHAFCQPHPPPEFVYLVDGFLKACDGLPLSLEVFGAMLCEEYGKSYWEEQLNGLQKLPRDIQVRLKISYDSLDPEEQQIFLDIACFSIGENKDKWIRIWGWSGWKGSAGFRNLENKCLVKVSRENEIIMHDHLRDMGRDIAKEESMPRRLWSATTNDLNDLLHQSTSSVIEVRGIIMDPSSTDTWEEGRFGDKKFRISKLQLLEAGGDLVEGILRKVPSPNLNLRWLRWNGCPCSSLPSCIPMGDLRFLEVDGPKLENLWELESQLPKQLRELNIHAPLLEFPKSLGRLQYLEKIALDNFSMEAQLSALPEEFCHVRSLQYLKLSNCPKLHTLPHCFGNLTNLRWINLWRCESLESLPNSTENLTNLQEINLAGCESLEVLPNAFGTFKNLREINLAGCKKLNKLPDFLENLTELKKISLENCKSLELLPNALGALENIQEINLVGCKKLKMLPDFKDRFKKLQEINLEGCESLKDLPYALGTSKNLRVINLAGCKKLKMLPNFLENLRKLQEIYMGDCKRLKELPNAFGTSKNLRKINLAGCKKLKMLPDFVGNLTELEMINLKGCKSLELLPNAFGGLVNLQEINLVGCKRLKKLPKILDCFKNLREINLEGCESLEVLPNAFGTLTKLQRINLRRCKSLKVLPDALGNLRNLQEINLSECKSLDQMLPNNFSKLTNLQYIDASHSSNLQMPSDPLRLLLKVKHLYLNCCCKLIISNKTLGNIRTLESLDLSGCRQMKVLPRQVVKQRLLKRLNLLGTNIKEFPNPPMGCLRNLEFLSLGSPLLKELPVRLGYLTSLMKLQLHGCRKLKCLPPSVGQLSRMRELEISKCGIENLPPAVMQLNNLQTLRVCDCPLSELPFKMVDREGEPSLLTESSQGRELDSSRYTGMDRLLEIHLDLTEISEVSFPAGVCPNLQDLKIRRCNDLVEVKALPKKLRRLDLRGCGALRKIGGLCGLAKLWILDIRGCCALEIEELPSLDTVISLNVLRTILTSLEILKAPFETCYPNNEEEEEEEERMMTEFVLRGWYRQKRFRRVKV